MRWYERRRPGLGAEFFDAVVETTILIAERPESGSLSPDERTRRLMVHRLPYQVVYRVTGNEIIKPSLLPISRDDLGYRKRRV